MATATTSAPASDRLAEVAQQYRAVLAELGAPVTDEFSLTPYDRTGVPVVATVCDLPDTAAGPGQDAHGVGYGDNAEQATVGALGEVAERVIMGAALRELPVRHASFRALRGELGAAAVADPVSLIIDADADYDESAELAWVPAQRWRTGEEVWVPAEFAAFDPASVPMPARGSHRLITPITNGLGAGDSLERAVGHALLELVQRDGDNVGFRALDQGVVVDVDAVPAGPLHDVLAMVRAVGIEPVIKLASTEFACVVYCVGADNDPLAPPMALGAIGEAAHPDREVAISKAVLEFASSRARRIFAFGPFQRVGELDPDYHTHESARPVGDQEQRALHQMRRWAAMDADTMRAAVAPLFEQRSREPFAHLPQHRAQSPTDLLELMLARLSAFDVLVVPGGVPGGMRAAKVLAPGLEVETMSYLRAGERAVTQLLARNSPLVGRGAVDAPDRLPVRLSPEATERLAGPVWLDRSEVARAMGPLYPLYREPRRHAVDRIAG